MAFCTKCGAQVPDGTGFCSSCGAPIGAPAGQQGQQQYQQGQQFQQNQQFQNAANFAKGINNTADYTNQYAPQDIQEGRVMSILAYFGILFFLPLVVTPNSKYGRFHANQGLLLLLWGVAVGVVNGILYAICRVIFGQEVWGIYVGMSGAGSFIYGLLSFLISVPGIYLFIVGLINAINNRAKELPFIGKIRIIK